MKIYFHCLNRALGPLLSINLLVRLFRKLRMHDTNDIRLYTIIKRYHNVILELRESHLYLDPAFSVADIGKIQIFSLKI